MDKNIEKPKEGKYKSAKIIQTSFKYNQKKLSYDKENIIKLNESENSIDIKEKIGAKSVTIFDKIHFVILIFIGLIVTFHILHYFLSKYVRKLFNDKYFQFSLCLYLFSSIILSEIIFILCYYIKSNDNKGHNKNEISTNEKKIYLNRVIIVLILFNSAQVKFKIFSTIELKIFLDKNMTIINAIYLFLFFYIVGYISLNIFFYFSNKNKKMKK